MINLYSTVLKSNTKRIGTYGLAQAINSFMPLLIYPLVINEIGISEYGRYLTALSIINLIVFVSNLGLDTYLISSKRIELIPTIVFLKSIIFIILLLLVNVFAYKYFLLDFVGIGMFALLLPKAYWQAVDKPRTYVVCSLVIKTSILFILFITEVTFRSYPIYLSIIQGIMLTLFFLKYLVRRGKFRIKSYSKIKKLLVISASYLFSEISVKAYTHLPKLLLGTVNSTALSIYDFYEKMYLFSRLPNQVLFDSFFTSLKTVTGDFLVKIWKLYFLVAILSTVLFTMAMPTFYELILHEDHKWLKGAILFGVLNLLMTINTFVGYGVLQMRIGIKKYRRNAFRGMLTMTLIISLLLWYRILGFNTLVYSMVLVEVIICVLNIRYIFYEEIGLFNRR